MSWPELPAELLACICQHVGDADLANWALVCKSFAAVVDDAAWRLRLAVAFPHSDWRPFEQPLLARLSSSFAALDVAPWDVLRASGQSPADRGGHACATLKGGRGFVVHGGANGDILHGDAYALMVGPYAKGAQAEPSDAPDFTWRRVGTDADAANELPPRWAHTGTCVLDDLVLFVGGHRGHRGIAGLTSALMCAGDDPSEWRWLARPPPPPPPSEQVPSPPTVSRSSSGEELVSFTEDGAVPLARYAHAACEHDGAIWIFGGIVGSPGGGAARCSSSVHRGTPRKERHENDQPGVTLEWKHVTPQGKPPAARYGHSFTCVRDVLVTVAGRALTEVESDVDEITVTVRVANDVHLLCGIEGGGRTGALRWERLSSKLRSIPTPRAFHSAVVVGDALLVMGGESGGNQEAGDGESEGVRYLADLHALHITELVCDEGDDEEAEAEAEAVYGHLRGSGVEAEADGPIITDASGGIFIGDSNAARSSPPQAPRSFRSWRRYMGSWQRLISPDEPEAVPAPPPASLAALVVCDTALLLFGGFNHKPDADMSELHHVNLAASAWQRTPTCPHCGQPGHWARSCPQVQEEGPQVALFGPT